MLCNANGAPTIRLEFAKRADGACPLTVGDPNQSGPHYGIMLQQLLQHRRRIRALRAPRDGAERGQLAPDHDCGRGRQHRGHRFHLCQRIRPTRRRTRARRVRGLVGLPPMAHDEAGGHPGELLRAPRQHRRDTRADPYADDPLRPPSNATAVEVKTYDDAILAGDLANHGLGDAVLPNYEYYRAEHIATHTEQTPDGAGGDGAGGDVVLATRATSGTESPLARGKQALQGTPPAAAARPLARQATPQAAPLPCTRAARTRKARGPAAAPTFKSFR